MMVRGVRRHDVALDELGLLREELAEVGGEGPVVGEDGCHILVPEDVPEPRLGISPDRPFVAHGPVPLQVLQPWTFTLRSLRHGRCLLTRKPGAAWRGCRGLSSINSISSGLG